MNKSLFFFSLLLTISCGILFAKPILLNGTAASVGSELLTVQEAYIFRAIQRFKNKEYPVVLIETGDALKRTIQKAAFEHMVYLELKSFEFESGNRGEIEKTVQKMKSQGKIKEWNAILEKFQISEKNVLEGFYRTLQVERFMQKKVDTLTPIVTDAEVEKYFQENPARFKGSNFAQMKPNIVVLLKKQQIQKGLEEWIQFLKEKYGFAILLEG